MKKIFNSYVFVTQLTKHYFPILNKSSICIYSQIYPMVPIIYHYNPTTRKETKKKF